MSLYPSILVTHSCSNNPGHALNIGRSTIYSQILSRSLADKMRISFNIIFDEILALIRNIRFNTFMTKY